jgi:ATP-dependent RNA helicase DDX49/DBP8
MAPKRKILTTDDLLRSQDDLPRKKSRAGVIYSSSNSTGRRELLDDEDSDSSGSGIREGHLQGDEDEGDDHDEEDESENDNDKEAEAERFQALDRIQSRFNKPISRPKPVPNGKSISRSHTSLEAPEPRTFAALNISLPLRNALQSISIHTPTEVQAACIPPLLAGE